MVDPDDAVLEIVDDALDRLVVDFDIDPAAACTGLAIGALAEAADLGSIGATLVAYRSVLEHLLGELYRLEAGRLH
jgi:hypothetical protein